MDAVGEDIPRTVRFFGREIPRDLFFVRLFYLLYFASFGSLFPLLAVYFKQLGMTPAQAGMLLGSRPLIEFAASPFWGIFADRFRKGKVLLLFSLGAMIVFTLAIGFVQPITPFCVVLDKNDTGGECKLLVPASEVVRGGALGYLKEAAGFGRRRRRETGSRIIDKIIDLSTYDSQADMVAGKAPEYITKDKVCNYDEEIYGVLVSPPHSTRVYRQPGVEQAFMLLLILIALGEFFSSPALALADGYTLSLVADRPKDFGSIRLFGSMGWGMAMFIMEKNYTLCFVACTLLALAAMGVTTQFRFPQPHQQHRPDEVGGLVMDTRIEEVDPAMAQKTRAKQLQANTMSEEAAWKSALKAMMNIHFAVYLMGVVVVGFGAGNGFAFLYWHLQDLGGTPILFGMCSIIINKYGYVKTMYMCLGANVVRLLLISWISNPWMILPLQAVQGCVLAVVWATATSYVSLVSPPHLKSTSQYILALLYHGLGKGIGPMIGGVIINSTGTRGMFAISAFLTLLVLGANYGANRMLKFDANKYSHNFEDDDDIVDTLAPQGLPMRNQATNKITEAFNQTSVINTNYGAIANDTANSHDEAYDRYVSNPYQ
ncbi:MFS_1 like family domain-containing protein [Ditylenchus destructor]|nr:MFS_1 like family domain-containing protein [Ditylenchus destructor]